MKKRCALFLFGKIVSLKANNCYRLLETVSISMRLIAVENIK